jgi:succinate-semialdehyde dehydrogenase / glutarate-semialdehyde dehydrogenase
VSEVRYAVVNPSSGEEVRSYPTATDKQVIVAVAQAHETFQQWSRRTSVADRAAVFRRVAELHIERREHLAATINREMGKPIMDGIGEVDFSASIYSNYPDNAVDPLADDSRALTKGEGSAVVRRRPLGCCSGSSRGSRRGG